jgi:hypothetical protein
MPTKWPAILLQSGTWTCSAPARYSPDRFEMSHQFTALRGHEQLRCNLWRGLDLKEPGGSQRIARPGRRQPGHFEGSTAFTSHGGGQPDRGISPGHRTGEPVGQAGRIAGASRPPTRASQRSEPLARPAGHRSIVQQVGAYNGPRHSDRDTSSLIGNTAVSRGRSSTTRSVRREGAAPPPCNASTANSSGGAAPISAWRATTCR